jgi:hypothetical protein
MGGPGSGRKKGSGKLKTFSATVKDKDGKLISITNKKETSLSAFKKTLAKNGFKVYKNRIANSSTYDKLNNSGVHTNWKNIKGRN